MMPNEKYKRYKVHTTGSGVGGFFGNGLANDGDLGYQNQFARCFVNLRIFNKFVFCSIGSLESKAASGFFGT